MYRSMLTAFALVGFLLASSPAQDFKDKKVEFKNGKEPAKTPPKAEPGIKYPSDVGVPGEAEIIFLNGSKVRVTIQSEKLEIATIYGKLTVPMEDVESIEFGLHFPEGIPEKITSAIASLNSSDYREREKAAKTLNDLGPYAYPAVLKATRSKEAEVSKRAKEIVSKMQTKYSKKELKTSVDDRVVTPTHTIVGRILTATVKTKAEYFGEIDHKFANMRSLRAIGAPGQDFDGPIDATKHANNGTDWMDTGFLVDGRSTIIITAKGLVDQWPQGPGQYMVGPRGNRGGVVMPGGIMMPGGQKFVGPITGQTCSGMLLGKVGEDGTPFIIGDSFTGKLETEGKLYLIIGPSPWNCACTGSYDVKVTRKND